MKLAKDNKGKGKTVYKVKRDEDGLKIIGQDEIVKTALLRPNTYNYKSMSSHMLDKLEQNIAKMGFTVPIIVRSGDGHGVFEDEMFEIIDGEHRWKTATKLNMAEVRIIDLGSVTDEVAKSLCISLNELHGESNIDDLSRLVADIGATDPSLLDMLPMTANDIAAMQSLTDEQISQLDRDLPAVRPPDDEPESSGQMTTAEFLRLGDLSPDEDETLRAKLEALGEYLKDKGRPGGLLTTMCDLVATHLNIDIKVSDAGDDEADDDDIEDVRDDDDR